ncbi:MAG: serine hydrolase domain-containing protein [Acidimicrobiia bacterium]
MSARRTPVALPAIVFGLAVAAAFGSGAVGSAAPPLASGTFATVPTASGSSTDGTGTGTRSAGSGSTTTSPTDDTTPDDSPAVTALGPGVLEGVDWQVFDDRIAPPLMSGGAIAVSIAVAKDGRLVHAAAYGVADPASGEPVTAASRFRIASNSKVLTSTVALALVDEGLLELDEPVLAPLAAQFGVPLTDPRMEQVTLRHLLSHTSGFADFREEFFRGSAVGCEDATIAGFSNPLSGSPGQSANYSNMNFCIVGLLIELAAADSYESAVYDRLLTPLGITDMRVTGNNDVRPGEVVHPGDPGRNFMEVLGGAGSWVATAADLVAIVDSLDTSRPGWHPISPELADEMQGRTEAGRLASAYRFGLGLRLFGDGWGHTGTLQNAHSMVMHRSDGFTFAILASGSAPSESDDLARFADRGFEAIGVPLLALVAPTPLATSSGTSSPVLVDGDGDEVR